MSNLNAGIILQGRSPDIAGSVQRGLQTASMQNEMLKQNRLAQIYAQDGAGIASGDPQAVNRLAAVDPMAARGINQQEFNNGLATNADQRADAQLGINQQNLGMRSKEFDMKVQQYISGLSAQEAAAEAQEVATLHQQALAAQTPEQYDAIMGSNPDTAQYVGSFAQRDQVAQGLLSIKEQLDMKAGPKAADEYQRYVQEESAAGREPLSRLEFSQAKKSKGFSVTTPDGTKVQYGGSDDSSTKADPSAPEAMVSSIDGILNDPALDWATGFLEFTQNIPGTASKRFQTKAKQLDGQAFLQAFQSLKGGGQITEIEGLKATQAIGRLDTAQSPDDYRDALNELRDVLVLGQSRPQGWIETQRKAVDRNKDAVDVSEMSLELLGQLHIESLSPEELDAVSRRYDELSNE